MNIYSIADILTGVVEAVLVLRIYETFCEKKEKYSDIIYFIGVIAVALMINISNVMFNYGLLNAVGMITAFFLLSFLFKGKISTKIILVFLTVVLIGIMEIMVLFGITLIFKVTVLDVMNSQTYRLLGIIVSKMLSLLLVNIIYVKFGKNKLHIKTSYWILFLLIFATSVITIFLIFKLSFETEKVYMHNLAMLCSFGLLFSTFFSIYLYEHLIMQSEKIKEQKQYEQHLKDEVKHLDEILISQNQLKKFKHDFINHMIGIRSFISDNDCNGAKAYIDNLFKEIENKDYIIETGNITLDAILSAKKLKASEKKIKFKEKIQIPENIDIDPVDICIIFGNALDNAIEASEKTKEKEIDLKIIYNNNYLFCKIENSALEVKENVTSKKDRLNHGFGILNMKKSLSKYNSEPIIIKENNKFILKFIIFIKQ